MLDAENAQHKIRLDGVDAPELKQPFGNASKRPNCHRRLHYGADAAECRAGLFARVPELVPE